MVEAHRPGGWRNAWAWFLALGTLALTTITESLRGKGGAHTEPSGDGGPPRSLEPTGTGEEVVRHDDGRIEHPAIRSEPSDANFWKIASVLFGAVVLAVVIFWSVWGFFTRYARHEADIKRSRFPLASTPSSTLPREPRLEQVNRLAGVERPDAHQRRERALNSYGKTEKKGFVHIPVDQAIKDLAGKLPVRKQEEGKGERHDRGLVDNGGPNSGRMFRKE
jgi:hypothetical protein